MYSSQIFSRIFTKRIMILIVSTACYWHIIVLKICILAYKCNMCSTWNFVVKCACIHISGQSVGVGIKIIKSQLSLASGPRYVIYYVTLFCMLHKSGNTLTCKNHMCFACYSHMSICFLTCTTCKKVQQNLISLLNFLIIQWSLSKNMAYEQTSMCQIESCAKQQI